MLGWYREWKAYGVLPYGEANLLDEPAFVFEAIDTINTEIDGMKIERQKQLHAEHEAAMRKARR